MNLKTIILTSLFFITLNGHAAGGYRSYTFGLSGGVNYYHDFHSYTSGLYFDRYYFGCRSKKTYEGLQLEYGWRSGIQKYSGISIKVSKGFMRPIRFMMPIAIHPVISIQTSYYNYQSSGNFSLRPELGIIISEIRQPMAARLAVFYGYDFPIGKSSEMKLKGNMIGLKLICGVDFTKLLGRRRY